MTIHKCCMQNVPGFSATRSQNMSSQVVLRTRVAIARLKGRSKQTKCQDGVTSFEREIYKRSNMKPRQICCKRLLCGSLK